MAKKRPSFNPLASQPRSPKRRPGDTNEQSDHNPDPNVEFIGTQSSAVGGDPTQGILRLFRALWRRSRRGRGDSAA